MIKTELIKKSPIRVFEKSINGGLSVGDLGVFTARKGVGKTASLIQIAMDKLLQGDKVLHISFADDPHHIEGWYTSVFNEIKQTFHLDNASDIFEELLRQKMIVHFKQKNIDFVEISKTIQQIKKNADFEPTTIIVDGFPFDQSTVNQLQPWKTYAEENKNKIWFSATLHRDNLQLDSRGVPSPINKFYDLFTVIIRLIPRPHHIEFHLLKAKNTSESKKLKLKLDPKSLLITHHRV